MPFDPNKPYEVVPSKKQFDPNRPYQQKDDETVDIPGNINEEKVYDNPMGQGESFLRGGAQGLTADFADEIAARVMSMINSTPYKDERTKQRQQFQTAQEQNPISYGAGQFTGGMAQGAALSAIPGGALVRLGGSTALGGLQGYGASEAETFEEAVPDIMHGAKMGLGAGLFGEALPLIGQGARSFGVNRSAASLGAERGTIKSIGPKKVREAGEMALQQNTFGPFTQTGGMQTRNKGMLKRAWEGMEDVFNQIDATGKSYFSPYDAAVKFEKKAGQFDRRLPINQSKVRTYERNMDSILQKAGKGDGNITFSDAMSLKSDLDDLAKWKSQEKITVQEQMARDAYHAVNEAIDDAVERASQELGDSSLGQQLKQSRKMYAAGKTAETLLANRYAREQGNKMGTGLTNTIVGAPAIGAAIATGDPKYLGIIAAKIGYEKFGQQSMARSANALADILQASPERLGRYAPAMLGALQKGGQSLAVQHYIMSQKDPNYVEAVRQALEDDEKKKIESPRYGGLGADIGNMIDNVTWSDKVGLDPQEQEQSGFQYGEGVPQPASIKPFSFKKLFPSKSAVGSEVKQLPPVKGYGNIHDKSRVFTPEEELAGKDWYSYRDLIKPKPFEPNSHNVLRYKEGQTDLSEDVFAKKIDARNAENGYLDETISDPKFLTGEGIMYHKGGTGTAPAGAFARSQQATKHEHIHTQIERLNDIHPYAGEAMDRYLRKKARDQYGIPIDLISTQMHGPAEFMPIVGDILENERTRKNYFSAVYGDSPSMIKYKNNLDTNDLMRKMRRFYNDSATEIQAMGKNDIWNIVQEYIDEGKKRAP